MPEMEKALLVAIHRIDNSIQAHQDEAAIKKAKKAK